MQARVPTSARPAIRSGAVIVQVLTLPVALGAIAGTLFAQETITVEKVAYHGWSNNVRLSNGEAELIATLDVGPRIISYRLEGGPNVFKNYDDQLGEGGEPEWMIRGGHRLWTAPEDTTRTYATDNVPVEMVPSGPNSIRLISRAAEREYGVLKEIEVRMETTGSRVFVTHRIENVGKAAAELAPWALSVMAPGGVEVLPLPPKAPHPGSPKNAKSPADFAANQLMRLWAYTDMQDPRWHFGGKYITLRQDPSKGPTKLGLDLSAGWAAYANDGTLFVKRFERLDGRDYPDGGCNYETFTNEDMLEMESLGPLVKLEPGRRVEHLERWELFSGLRPITDEASIDAEVLPRARP